MASYEDQMANISSLSDEELSALETSVVAAFDEADAADDLDAMTAAADALDLVRAEKANRGGSEQPEPETGTVESEVVAASGADPAPAPAEPVVTPDPAVTPDAPTPAPEPLDPADPVKDESGEAEPDEGEPAEPAQSEAGTETNESEAVAASAQTATEGHEEATVEIPEDRKPVVASAVRVTAGADIPGFSAGTEFQSASELSRAFIQRLNSVKRATGGDGEQHVVATLLASAPEDRTLDSGDAESNWEKIRAVVSREAITASGGFCAPLETRYEIFGVGQGDRPVRDSLPGFNASRGGIRYVTPPTLAGFSGAIGTWTKQNDIDAGAAGAPDPTKPCLVVTCSPEVTAEIDAITLCLQFGNLMSRAYPELVERNNELALVAHSRYAEIKLLNAISAASTAYTSGFKLGTARDLLLAIGKAASAYRNKHRLDNGTPLRVILPAWARDAMREDIAQGLPGDRLAEADSVIDGYLSARKVNVTWHLDDAFPAPSAGALSDFPATIKWYIFAEGTFLLLDGGTLDLGIVRDSALVSTNDYKTFVEVFENVAKVGVESWAVTTTTHVVGSVIGTTAPA